MASYQGIQARGKTAIMRLYDNAHVIAWSVCYGKNVNMKYAGQDENDARNTLDAFLDQLEASESAAVYTLRLYEQLPKGAIIKYSTEPDYAFNFLIVEDEPPRYGRNRDLIDRITKLEAENNLLKNRIEAGGDDGDEEDRSLGGIISGLLDDERIKTWIKEKAIGWADKMLSAPPINQANVIPMNQGPAKVGAVKDTDPYLVNEEQQVKIQQAIETLARLDPNLGDNLLKIAKIAENDPVKYNMFSKML
jgi:hypothetical protein